MAASALNFPVNAMQFPSLTAALATANPATLTGFTVLGYAQPGDLGDGIWKKIAGPTTNTYGSIVPPGIQQKDAAGNWFQYVPGDEGVVANAVGPLAQDCVLTGLGEIQGTPTDDLAVLQAAVDASIYIYHTKCTIKPGGTACSFLSATLQVGYGLEFAAATLDFLGGTYKAPKRPDSPGSILAMSRADCPIVAVQGARGTTILNATLQGPMQGYIQRNRLGLATVNPAIDDTQIANWLDPRFPNANSRYAPQAGIAIDPAAGPAPPGGYPASAFIFPQWYANLMNGGQPIAQYNKNYSSDVLIHRPGIQGCVCPVVVQPCNADGNGDFTKIIDAYMSYNVYCVSVGNGQSRTVRFSNANTSIYHTGLVNDAHGRQIGQFGGVVDNWGGGCCIQMFQLNGYAGPITFLNCYQEQAWMWGTLDSYLSITLQACKLEFGNQTAKSRGVPMALIAGVTASNVTIENTSFTDYYSVIPLLGVLQGYEMRNCQTGVPGNASTSPYQIIAQNFLGGGVVFQPTSGCQTPGAFSALQVLNANCLTRASQAPKKITPVNPVSRAFPQCAWATAGQPMQQPGYSAPTPPLWMGVAAKSFTNPALTGTSLTMGCPAGFTANEMKLFGMVPGCVLISPDGTVFFIHSNTGPGGQIVAEQQTNFRGGSGLYGSGAGAKPISPVNLTSGQFMFGNALLYMASYFTQGTLATNSPTATATGRADGYAAYLATDLAVGDLAYVNAQTDFWLGLGNLNITAIAPAGTSITFAGDPNYAQANKPLTWFIAAPPANQVGP